MVMLQSLLFTVALLVTPASSLSVDVQMSKSRLQDALSSVAGKLTLSPEIIIPVPTDMTAILLQASAIQTLSSRLRTQAKANTAFIDGTVTSVETFCAEQESARGNFPGPIPVVYFGTQVEDMDTLAEAGAMGIVVTVQNLDDMADTLKEKCQAALACGLQPIPEMMVDPSCNVESLVDAIHACLGMDPAALLLTFPAVEVDVEPAALPSVSKDLKKRVPILGSVRVPVGENRMGMEVARFKDAGFTGAILRSECVAGFRVNTDIDVVGKFWANCIGDLKSTKSKSFSFRSKNAMNKDLMTEWTKFSMDVVESGALGPEDMETGKAEINTDAGDYKGF
jgi:hypothetical protein